MKSDDPWFAACHEAGHATLALMLRLKFGYVAINGTQGKLILRPPKPELMDRPTYAEHFNLRHLKVTYAGMAAELKARGARCPNGLGDEQRERIRLGAAEDTEAAARIEARLSEKATSEALLWAGRQINRDDVWQAICALAQELITKEMLLYGDARAIVQPYGILP